MVAAMLTVAFALLIPPALAGMALEPFLIATVVLAQLLPSVLVTAAVDGRAGVRELVGRIFRWRVHPIWYAVAFLALPVAALLASAAVFGSTAGLHALVTDPAVIATYIAQLAILPLINLWEETAVMGVIQARLAATRGPLVAAVLTGLVFGFYHLPLWLGRPFGEIVAGMAVLLVLAVLLRVVAGWLYVRTGGSILLVAGLHATFNAVNNNTLLTATAPGSTLLAQTAPILVAAWGIGLIVATRGRLTRA
jgi:CAAX protease family protein